MHVLALNCGSSSLKFALYEAAHGDPACLARGQVERIGDAPRLEAGEVGASAVEVALIAPGHEAAANGVLDWLADRGLPAPDAIGHRVVHGGPSYREPVRIDADVLAAIEAAGEFARLHNAPALATIRAVAERVESEVIQVAVFDTALHRDMPARASRYAIPLDVAERHGFERFGFHGIAHEYMAGEVARERGAGIEDLRAITLQLGSGCSAAAIDAGRSIDTTMGLTPLEGLMMATRSGDVDPALPGLLARAEGMSIEDAERWLNEQSGLLGVSGRSADMRDLLAAEQAGDERSALAIEMFCYRVLKQIGAYLAALEGCDAIVFGGGIGEHQPEIRRRIIEPLEWLGVRLAPRANERVESPVARISAAGSSIEVYVVQVDEQQAIARATAAVAAS